MTKKIAILDVLKEQEKSINSAKIKRLFSLADLDFNERTIRFYLKELDEVWLAVTHGRKGRKITEAGLAELHFSRIIHNPLIKRRFKSYSNS